MSAFRDPPRILESSEAVPSILREGLEAEHDDAGPDRSHIERLAARFPSEETIARANDSKPRAAWTRIVTLAGAGLLGLIGFAVESRSVGGPSALTTTSAAPVARDHASPVEESGPAEPPTFRPDELPTATAPAPRVAPARPASSTSARAPLNEGAEIDLLDRAQKTLNSNAEETLALCRKHQADFPNGRFIQEREALAIEALVYLHRREEAQRRWNDFQQRYPASNHRTHLADLFSSPSR